VPFDISAVFSVYVPTNFQQLEGLTAPITYQLACTVVKCGVGAKIQVPWYSHASAAAAGVTSAKISGWQVNASRTEGGGEGEEEEKGGGEASLVRPRTMRYCVICR